METENNLVQDVKEEPIAESNEEKTPDAVPYSRFKGLVDEKNTYKTELHSLKEQIAKKEEDAKLKELESKGEYDRIISDMNQKLEKERKEKEEYRIKAIAHDDYQVARKNALLEKLPENERAIYDELSLDKLEAHVDKVKTTNIPSVDNSAPANAEGYKSLTDLAQDFNTGKINMDTYTRLMNVFRKN